MSWLRVGTRSYRPRALASFLLHHCEELWLQAWQAAMLCSTPFLLPPPQPPHLDNQEKGALGSITYPRGQRQLFGLNPPEAHPGLLSVSLGREVCQAPRRKPSFPLAVTSMMKSQQKKKSMARESRSAGEKGLGLQLRLNKWQQATRVEFCFLERFQTVPNPVNKNCHWGRETYFSFLLRNCRCYSMFCGGEKVSWSNWKVPISEMLRERL